MVGVVHEAVVRPTSACDPRGLWCLGGLHAHSREACGKGGT